MYIAVSEATQSAKKTLALMEQNTTNTNGHADDRVVIARWKIGVLEAFNLGLVYCIVTMRNALKILSVPQTDS